MDPIEAARSTLPGWVSWGPLLVYPPLACGLGIVLSMGGAALGLIGFDRTPPDAWAERARVAWPARVGSTINMVLMPLVFGVSAILFGGALSRAGWFTLGAAAGLAALVGAVLARRWVDRRVGIAPIGARRWLRSLAAVLIAYQPQLPVVIAGMIAAGPELDLRAGIAFVLAGGLMLWLATGRGLLVARALGIAGDAPPRVREICERVATRIGQPLRGVDRLDWAAANALAYPLLGRIAFTPRALEVLDDDEIEAVAAHEVGHLRESRSTSWTRVGTVMLFSTLILLLPLYDAIGVAGLVVPFLIVAIGALLFRNVARRMEVHADAVAHDHANDSGVYARALEKLYRANLAPAVMPQGRKVHPDLYDRMLAAGVTPAFPRPAPPSRLRRIAVSTVPFLLAIGLIFVLRVAVVIVSSFGDGLGEGALLATIAISGGDPGDLNALAQARLARGDHEGALVLARAAAAGTTGGRTHYASDLAYFASMAGECDEARAAAETARVHATPGWDDDYVAAARNAADSCIPGVTH